MTGTISLDILPGLPALVNPRLGRLRQHAPKNLRIPARYLRTTIAERPPTITLVTPSYQQGGFLDRTIYSVVNQRYPALEYVVQDGGSSDQTLDVIRRFEPLLTRWASEPDDGQADAINRGFRDTAGDLMAWLNSDDLLLPGSLAFVAQFFLENPDVDVVYGHRVLIDEKDNQVGAWVLPRHDDTVLTLMDFVPQETLFWRRSAWDAVGGCVDTTFRYALDWDLLLRFRDVGARIVRAPRYIGAFRVHDEQKTTATHGLGLEECARLSARVHGRDVPAGEIARRLKPYLVRHMLLHASHVLVGSMPIARVDVSTVPTDESLDTASAPAKPSPRA